MVAQHILQVFQPNPSIQSRFQRSQSERPIFQEKSEIFDGPLDLMEQIDMFPQNLQQNEPKSRRDPEVDYPFPPKHSKEPKEHLENFFFRF